MTNLVLFMADQLRADALGCYGNGAARTPVLDGLAARGARFLDHLTPNQICSPSRGTLFSGYYPRHHGVVHNGIALPETIELISHALATAGYRTYGVGKCHFQPILASRDRRMPDSNAFWILPESAGWRGPFYGFQTVDLVIGESLAATEGGHYARWLADAAPGVAKLYRREQALASPPGDLDDVWKCAVPERLHYNTWVADHACAFLRDLDPGDPFFLFVSFPDPHHPFTPPAPWCDLFDPASLPAPREVAGELERMPDYIASGVLTEGEPGDAGRTYLDFLLAPGPSREQGFMITTRGISEATLRLAIAHTYGSVAMVDACIGSVLDALAGTAHAGDTIVVFTSDHGELLGDHGLLRKGPPPYRQLLQVPLLVAGPGIDRSTIDRLTSHVDLKATLLDLLGIVGDPGDGISFVSALRGGHDGGHDAVFAEYHPRTVRDQYNQTLVTPDWRITIYPRRRDWGELFDRRADPNEHRNLFHEPAYAEVRERLLERLSRDWPPAPNAGGVPLAVY